jgi:transposase
MGFVDTFGQVSQVGMAKAKKRRRTIKKRRDIVEETLVPGASVARVARRNDVNANQVFYGRKLYREGRPGISMATQLQSVEAERPAETVRGEDLTLSSGTMEIKLPRGTLRIAGL